MIRRIAYFVYGALCYVVFLGTFLYAIGFVTNAGVPKGIDAGPQEPFGKALLIDSALLAVFAAQHSIMARRWFKRAWTRVVPLPVERSTYVLFASAALLLLFSQWRPIGGTVWSLSGESAVVVQTIGALGWMLVLAATFLIDHFDLFGLKQVYLNLTGKPHGEASFRTPGVYRFVRHPLYLGFIVAFWAAPVMTGARLVFAAATTAYILMAIRWEERDLILIHGRAYREYRERVPMLLPVGVRGAEEPAKTAAAQ